MSYSSGPQLILNIQLERTGDDHRRAIANLARGQEPIQGDIEKRTGLLRCYLSRVECGHTVPSIETLEKWARALEVSLYQLFYEGDNSPALPKYKSVKIPSWGASGKHARLMAKFHRLLSRTAEDDRKLLLHMARKMADQHSV